MKNKYLKPFVICSILSLGIFMLNSDTIYGYENSTNGNNEVYINQLEAKTKLFQQALDKFGAITKEDAVTLYAEGVKQRSGPLQYSVMCPELKKSFSKKMDRDKNYAWVTGVSSPWITSYRIMSSKKFDESHYIFTVRFFYEDAKGPSNTTTTLLKVKQCKDRWCIVDIKEEI